MKMPSGLPRAVALLLFCAACEGSEVDKIALYSPASATRHNLAQAEADCKVRHGRYDDQDRHNDKRSVGSILLGYKAGPNGAAQDARVICAYPNSDCVGDALAWLNHASLPPVPAGTEMRADYQYGFGDSAPKCKSRMIQVVE
jgi:hypothetical protein